MTSKLCFWLAWLAVILSLVFLVILSVSEISKKKLRTRLVFMDTSPKAQYENANRYDKISGFVLCFVAKVALNSWIATI